MILISDPRDADAFVTGVTPGRTAKKFGQLLPGEVTCRPCPALGTILVVVRARLRGGVPASLALDAHGNTRSGYLPGLSVPWIASAGSSTT